MQFAPGVTRQCRLVCKAGRSRSRTGCHGHRVQPSRVWIPIASSGRADETWPAHGAFCQVGWRVLCLLADAPMLPGRDVSGRGRWAQLRRDSQPPPHRAGKRDQAKRPGNAVGHSVAFARFTTAHWLDDPPDVTCKNSTRSSLRWLAAGGYHCLALGSPVHQPSPDGTSDARSTAVAVDLGGRGRRAAGLDHPFDHPDDPTGPVWIRPDRRGTQREQARSVGSRPDRRRAPGYGSGGWR